jgi:hypothetical protein
MGIAFRFQNGEIQVNHNRFLGYTKDENKRLVIVPKEAEIVKRIYREFLEGASLLQIGRGLEADGILTAAGKPKWRPETIRKILKNEKYFGDALLQKTYTVDYRRVHWNNRGKKSIVWRCASRLEEKGSDCGSPTVPEEELQKAVLKAINSIIAGRDEFIETLRRNIETALGGEFDESTEAIDKKLEELQHELLRLASTKAAYDSVVNEIYRFREVRQETLASRAERQNRRQRIAEMMEFLESQSGVIFEYDEKLVRRLVEKVTVFEDKTIVEFKSSSCIEVKM